MRATISNADKTRVTTGITTDPATKERLIELANDKHTSVSALISQWVWSQETRAEKAGGKAGEKDE